MLLILLFFEGGRGGDCQVVGLPSQISAIILFSLFQTSLFSREILNESSLTHFYVSNQFDTFCDVFKFIITNYLVLH